MNEDQKTLSLDGLTIRDVTLDDIALRNPKAVEDFGRIIVVIIDEKQEPEEGSTKRIARETVIGVTSAVASSFITVWVAYYWPVLMPALGP